MKTSVVCCVYNGARYLPEQLDSIVRQTVLPDEIVIVDDASNDDSPQLIEAFARSAPDGVAVVPIRNLANVGVVANFERGLAQATGDLVFLSDQDDVWAPTKLETMRAAFEARTDLDFLFTNARLIDATGKPMSHALFDALGLTPRERRLVRDGAAFDALLGRNLATGATVALRRPVVERARPFPSEWVHDEWLAVIAAATGGVDYLDACLIDYRQHGGNQIGMRRLSLTDKFAKLFRHRGERYRRLERRAEVLAERLAALPGVPARRVAQAREKVAHARVRAALPTARIARIQWILREAGTGRYTRYSLGIQDVVRDCTEPA
jgi:glycosyltransferase involved in cell wall biosynthesis